jgi:hypothetical protein
MMSPSASLGLHPFPLSPLDLFFFTASLLYEQNWNCSALLEIGTAIQNLAYEQNQNIWIQCLLLLVFV